MPSWLLHTEVCSPKMNHWTMSADGQQEGVCSHVRRLPSPLTFPREYCLYVASGQSFDCRLQLSALQNIPVNSDPPTDGAPSPDGVLFSRLPAHIILSQKICDCVDLFLFLSIFLWGGGSDCLNSGFELTCPRRINFSSQ